MLFTPCKILCHYYNTTKYLHIIAHMYVQVAGCLCLDSTCFNSLFLLFLLVETL